MEGIRLLISHKYLMLSVLLIFFTISSAVISQPLPPVFGIEYRDKYFNDSRVRTYLSPLRIVWTYGAGRLVRNADCLLLSGNNGQSDLSARESCVMRSTDNELSSIVLDFGRELHGGLQIVTSASSQNVPIKIRVRFGESVSEAMSTVIGGDQGATNDHAMRDFTLELPWLGVSEVGNSGFRFVRIDLLTPNVTLSLKEVNAIFIYRDIPYLGSFRSNDDRLNRIWLTGAYTVHLNMQEYLWDGIKRDRLVWLGDMHPEVMTASAVFGFNEVIPKSLDLSRDITPLPDWMNGMCSYSLWWIIIHRDWYKYQGDLPYLRTQQSYLEGLLNLLLTKVDESGKEHLNGGGRFLDWSSSPNVKGVDAGLQALMVLAFRAGSELCTALGNSSLSARCTVTADLMRTQVPDHNGLKQAAALLSLADMLSPLEADSAVISVGGVKGFSTFYGYYMLQALAQSDNYLGALSAIREYWGGMLDMGATTFWEDFDVAWMEDAAGIDELVPEGKRDIHADFGDYCYKKLRHSLCHGWSAGPTAWLSEHVLGVKVLSPGCRVIKIEPHLGDLEWVEGTFPTPQGVVSISHRRQPNGKIKTSVKAPQGVKIIQ